jgi:hypothetical protein
MKLVQYRWMTRSIIIINLQQAAYEDYGIYPDYMLTYGGRSHEFASALQKADGDFLFLAGSTGSFGYRKSKGYVYKTDLTGRVIWQSVIQLDQPGNFNLYGLVPDGEGGCIFAGSFLPQLDAENYNYTHFYYGAIGRLDADGNVVWFKPVRPAGDNYGLTFKGLIKTTDENYMPSELWTKEIFKECFSNLMNMAIRSGHNPISLIKSVLVMDWRCLMELRFLWETMFILLSPIPLYIGSKLMVNFFGRELLRMIMTSIYQPFAWHKMEVVF